MTRTVIRDTASRDLESILALYPQAFPEEELRPAVAALVEHGHDVLSLGAFRSGQLSGHILFTVCGTSDHSRDAALLGPVGIVPPLQRQGLGSSLIRTGLERLQTNGIAQVFVLGDPDYYRRFGFLPERRILAPYPIPEPWADAWQSVALRSHSPLPAGRLVLPEPWMQPALWGP